jgi:GH43 family beta-xylosidase
MLMLGIATLVFAYRGRLYFVYSAYVGPDSKLMIAPMTNPWTLGAPETLIAVPDKGWEKQGGRQILEGPEFLLGPKGDLFLTYSGSACWSDDYALGMLHAAPGSNPLDPAAWSKSPIPVFAKDARRRRSSPRPTARNGSSITSNMPARASASPRRRA